MGKIRKKGTSGIVTQYMNRNKAVRKLQISLADFRRLCILKGIYPRQPPNYRKVNKGSTEKRTFYLTSDIRKLQHEPILFRLREFKVFLRKFKKAVAKKQYSLAKNLDEKKPLYSIDHLIKERYPTFIDALRDLDDSLCLIFLFANMPVTNRVQADMIEKCQRLCLEFQHYIILSNSLRKVFLSIKGIYYQVNIRGQDITWVVPYKFSQKVPDDVDFRIMKTFLEFSVKLIGFVNFKLFTELNVIYPPTLDLEKDQNAAGLSSLLISSGSKKSSQQTLESNVKSIQLPTELQEKIDKYDNQTDAEMEEIIPLDEQETFPIQNQLDSDLNKVKVLFKDLQIFLSREVPKESLEFVIKSFGGQVGWDETVGAFSPFSEKDTTITHQVVDRPTLSHVIPNRIYVQPQWVYDCINSRKLLDTSLYAPGAPLPAHLSPFVQYKEGDYIPEEAMGVTEENDQDVTVVVDGSSDDDDHIGSDEDVSSEEDTKPAKGQQRNRANHGKKQKVMPKDEERELAAMMLSKKKRRMYHRLTRSNARDKKIATQLQERKNVIKKSKKKTT